MRLARAPLPVEPLDERRIDVERHDALGEAQRIQARRRPGRPGSGRVGPGRDFVQLRARSAVDLLDAGVLGIRIDARQDGVADHPVEVGALAGRRGPFGHTPGAVGVRVLVALPLAGRILDVVAAIGQVHDLGAGLGLGGGGAGELALVEEVDLDGDAGHVRVRCAGSR